MLYHLATAMVLFVTGMAGVFLSRRNVILTIMSLEVMLLSISFNILFFSTYLDDVVGNLFILFILAVSAAESALGLSLVITYYKQYN
jgi:NADH-quinone oxidoreductase subunit K